MALTLLSLFFFLFFTFHLPSCFSGTHLVDFTLRFAISSRYLVPTLVSHFSRFNFAGQSSSMESVPDLQNIMYASIDGYPCVRLHNLSGTIGCSSESHSRFPSLNAFFRLIAVLGINCNLQVKL